MKVRDDAPAIGNQTRQHVHITLQTQSCSKPGERQEGVDAHEEGAHGQLAEGALAVSGALRGILFLAGEESDVHDTPWEHPIPCPLSHKLVLQYAHA